MQRQGTRDRMSMAVIVLYHYTLLSTVVAVKYDPMF